MLSAQVQKPCSRAFCSSGVWSMTWSRCPCYSLHISLPLKRRACQLNNGLSSLSLYNWRGKGMSPSGTVCTCYCGTRALLWFSEISYQEASPWVEKCLFLWLLIIFLTQHGTKKMVRSCSSSDARFLWGFFWLHCMACRILSKDQTCAPAVEG